MCVRWSCLWPSLSDRAPFGSCGVSCKYISVLVWLYVCVSQLVVVALASKNILKTRDRVDPLYSLF